jgi:biotin carboxyl carrier protein
LALSDDRDLRITVEGPEALVVELAPEDVSLESSRSRTDILAVPSSDVDRAAGLRRYSVSHGGWVFAVTVASARVARLRERAVPGAAAQGSQGTQMIRAQIPGRVVRVWVAAGDQVEQGQRLLALEAMKMENEVRAPHAGTVESIEVAVGQAVELGAELVRIA